MRTQGAKEQRLAVIDTPRKNMKAVVGVHSLCCSVVCVKSVGSGNVMMQIEITLFAISTQWPVA